jgi:hypothetical protein
MAKTHVFFYFSSLLKKMDIDLGLRFEELRDGVRCRTTAMSFHCSVGHFHAEEGHCQDALQQRWAQHPRQCISGGLLGNLGWALATLGPQTDNSFVDAWLSKMEVIIENIASLIVIGNLAINQLMEREVVVIVIAKAAFTKEPKWTTVMAKNVC